MKVKSRNKLNIVLSVAIILLIILEMVLSLTITYENSKSLTVCLVGGSCNYVQNSGFGYVLGIKLVYLAVVAFAILLAFKFISKKIFLLLSIFGALVAIYYILVQIFILKQICSTCIVIDSTMLLIFFLAIIECVLGKKQSKRHK